MNRFVRLRDSCCEGDDDGTGCTCNPPKEPHWIDKVVVEMRDRCLIEYDAIIPVYDIIKKHAP